MRTLASIVAVLLLLSTNHGVSANQIHKWQDSQGNTHYTANPPPPGAKVLSKTPLPEPAPREIKSSTSGQMQASLESGKGSSKPAGFPPAAKNPEKLRLENLIAVEGDLLTEAKRLYSNGNVERLGEEKNYQRYLDRVAALKLNVERHENKIVSLKQQLAALK